MKRFALCLAVALALGSFGVAHAIELPTETWTPGVDATELDAPATPVVVESAVMPDADPSAVMEPNLPSPETLAAMNAPTLGDACVAMNNGNEAMRECSVIGKVFGPNE